MSNPNICIADSHYTGTNLPFCQCQTEKLINIFLLYKNSVQHPNHPVNKDFLVDIKEGFLFEIERMLENFDEDMTPVLLSHN